jgi:peptide/nickel transport system permease protein
VTLLRMILRRFALLVPLLLGMTVVVFLVVQLLPGNPATAVLGVFASQEQRDAFEAANGLDDPVWVRYPRFLGDLLQGDLGTSAVSGQHVLPTIERALPVTFQLTALAALFAALIALTAGILSAVYRGRWVDGVFRAVSMAGIAAPSFWVALMLVKVFALDLRWLPSGDYHPPSEGLEPWLRTMLLPAIALGLPVAASLTRVVRASVVEELEKDYVRTARGLGLPPAVVIGRNVLRNALITPMTVMGLRVAYLLSGAVIIESIFTLPGMGRLLITAVDGGDLAIIQGVVIVATITFILVNLVVDVLYIALNPRLRTA